MGTRLPVEEPTGPDGHSSRPVLDPSEPVGEPSGPVEDPRKPVEDPSGPVGDPIAVTAVKNILCGGREEFVFY